MSTLAAGAGAPLPSTVVTLHCWNGDAGPAAAAPAVGTGTNPTPKRNILRLRGGDCTAPSGLKDFTVFNIRGLKPRTRPSKVPYIRDILHETKQLFIVLTETWLYEQSDAEIDIDGYTLFRADRKVKKKSKHGRDSGGVAIYVRDDIAVDAERNLEFSNGVVEALAVHIPQIDTVAVGFYRTPENPATPDVKSGHSQLSQCITQLKEYFCNLPAPTPNIVICGDANLPSADWMEGICRTGTNRYREEQKMVSSLYEFASENFMVQQIEEPTHRDGNILDLIFTNNADIVHSYDIVPSSQSDHLMINVKANYSVTSHDVPTQEDEIEEEVSFRSLNFFHESTDWNGLNDSIAQHDWASEFESSDANEMLNHFVYTCLELAKNHVPLRRRPSDKKSRIPRYRRNLIRSRRRTQLQLHCTRSEERKTALNNRLVDIEKKLMKSYHQQEAEQENRAVSNIKENPKYFYSYAKSFSKVKVGVGPLINSAKRLISDPLQMASILSEQYASVFSQPQYVSNSPDLLFPGDDSNEQTLHDFTFTEEELERAMKDIASNSAAGPDGFPALLLKKCSHTLVHPFFLIWRKSLDTGVVPELGKVANIIPIHKGKSRALAKNYRPVALTSLLIKAFEKVVRIHLVKHLDDNNLFNESQHGFRSGRSCLSQLLAHFDKILKILESGNSVDVIYVDFAKAFDKVDFGVTLRKMKRLGIDGKIGRWLHNFLTGRTQTVIVNGRKSDPEPMKSGVPQGSVLGPLLFLILIGDIDAEIVSSFLSSFADDTRIGHVVSSDEDRAALQADLQRVYGWAASNNMQFNSDKFELMRYRGSSNINAVYTADDGTPIEEKNSLRDLGVTMSNDASFGQHIRERAAAMRSKVAWILRTFKTRNRLLMLTLWKSLVLSLHDFCVQLWCPYKIGDIQTLEMIQRSFVRKINGMHEKNYWEQLTDLKLYSLERRRERYIAIYVWKILEGIVPNLGSDSNIVPNHSARRGRSCKVPHVPPQAPTRIQTLRNESFAIKGPRIFNSLPMNIRNFTGGTVDAFKSRLDAYLKTVPDQPLIPGYTAGRQIDRNSLIDWAIHLALANEEEPVMRQMQQSYRADHPDSP